MTVLKAAGVTAVGRYIGWDGEPGYSNIRKNLTTTEARELLAAGMEIFLAFEYAADAALKGAVQGTADAHLATRQLRDLGAPAGVTVYFALDFNIGDFAPGSSDPRAKLGPAAHYFDAINAAKPTYKVGVYGGYPAVSRVLDAKLAAMGWQTIAWSGGRWDSRAVLRQLVTQLLGAADVELHEGRWPGAAASGAMLGPPEAAVGQYHRDFARMVLDSAAPLIAAAERQRIRSRVTIMRDETADQARQARALPSTSRVLKAEAEALD